MTSETQALLERLRAHGVRDAVWAADTIENLIKERDRMAEALRDALRIFPVDKAPRWRDKARALTKADQEKVDKCDCGETIGEAHKAGCPWASPPPQPPHGGPPLPTAPLPHWMKRMMG